MVVGEKATGLKSARERLEYVWAHPEAQERFEREYIASAEKKSRGAMRAMIAGPGAADPKAAMVGKAYQQAMREIPGAQAAAPYAERKIETMGVPFAQRAAATEQAVESGLERLYTETKTGRDVAVAGIYSREKLNALLQASGVGPTERMADLGGWYGEAGGHREAFEARVQSRIKELETPQYEGGWGMRFAWQEDTRTVSPEAQEQVQILRETLAEMRKQTTEIQKVNTQQLPVPVGAGFTEPGG